MNERIRELLLQATTLRGPPFIRFKVDQEKFAQLIVRECAGIAKGEPAKFIDRDPWKEGRRVAGSDVLKHFGVEE